MRCQLKKAHNEVQVFHNTATRLLLFIYARHNYYSQKKGIIKLHLKVLWNG